MGSIFNVPLVIIWGVNKNISTKTCDVKYSKVPKRGGGAIIRGGAIFRGNTVYFIC